MCIRDRDIYARLVNQDGSLFGSELPLGTETTKQRDVAVAFDGTRFLVVWQTRREGDPERWDVFGCFVSPAGATTAPFQISQSTSASHNPLCLAFDGSNYLVVWNRDIGSGYPEPTDWDVYGRLVSPAGTFPSAEFGMLTASGSQALPTVAFGNGHHLVCWNEGFGAPNCTVKARFFNTSGAPVAPEFTPFTAQGSLLPLIASPAHDGSRFAIAGTLGVMSTGGGLTDGDVFVTFAVFGAADSPCGAGGLSLAKWTFNEGSGAAASDFVGGHTATLSGATWEPSGFLSSGLRLSAGTSVVIPDFQVLDGLRTLQISFALYLDQLDTGGRMNIVSQITPSSQMLGLVSVCADDFANTAVRRSIDFALHQPGRTVNVAGTGVKLSPHQWYQVVCLYDGTKLEVKVNGVLAGSYTPASAPMPIVSTRDLVLGGFTGILDEVEISTFDPIEPPRPSLRLERANDTLAVHFTGTLESATDVLGPYVAVNQATSPYLASPSGARRFWRASIGGAAQGSPLDTMLQALPGFIASSIAENQSLLESNPHLTEQLQAKITMLQNPTLAGDIVNCRLYSEGGVTSRNGSRIPVVSVFPQTQMRADVIDSVRSLQLALPIIENFLETAFPASFLRLWYGFKLGNTGGGGMINSEDRGTYEARTAANPDRLPFESILHHELAHTYYGNESLTQFLELYIYNLIHTQSTDAHSWITTRQWPPGSASNTGVHALLDIYDLIGPAAMAEAYQVIYPLHPPYGQPLSQACRQAFVDQAPEPLKTQVAAKADKI